MKHKITIIDANITTLQNEAIVNAANNSLTGGGGVDGAIHKAAGPKLREYCAKLKGCATGNAKITPGFNLPSKFVIHTVGPVWNNGTANEVNLLCSCYQNSLVLAVENNVRTVAFPCISTGAYRFPFDKAALIALTTINAFLQQASPIERVSLVVSGEKNYKQYKKVFNEYFK